MASRLRTIFARFHHFSREIHRRGRAPGSTFAVCMRYGSRASEEPEMIEVGVRSDGRPRSIPGTDRSEEVTWIRVTIYSSTLHG